MSRELDHDETKGALVSMLGVFADRADAWLLAEGIETDGELAAAIDLGVPLGQGWALAQAAPPWGSLDQEVGTFIRSGQARVHARDRNPAATATTVMEVAGGSMPTTRRTVSSAIGTDRSCADMSATICERQAAERLDAGPSRTLVLVPGSVTAGPSP